MSVRPLELFNSSNQIVGKGKNIQHSNLVVLLLLMFSNSGRLFFFWGGGGGVGVGGGEVREKPVKDVSVTSHLTVPPSLRNWSDI